MTRIIAVKVLKNGRVLRVETDKGTFRFLSEKLSDIFNCKSCNGGTGGVSNSE